MHDASADRPDDPVHAFCRDNHVALQATGAGPLSGLRFAAKDVFDIAGSRTGFGQPDWLRTHAAAERTAPTVARILTDGAELVGRTICDELCYSLTGDNMHYGAPINRWNSGHLPGGSSSGSAAATCASLVDFALGTDTGGSVRVPASYCGLFGIRTTHGRISTQGLLPLSPEFDCIGWFARDPAVFAGVGRSLLPGARERGAFKRALIATDAFEAIAPEVAAALEPARETLCSHVGQVREIRLSDDGLGRWFETFRVIQAADVWAVLGDWVTQTRPTLGPGIRERVEQARHVGGAVLRGAWAHRQRIIARLDDLIGPDDVVILPTTPRSAPPRGGARLELETRYRFQAMSLLCSAGLAGLPQVNIPLAWHDDLPLGVSVMTRRHSDMRLLELAGEVCSSAPTPDRIRGRC